MTSRSGIHIFGITFCGLAAIAAPFISTSAAAVTAELAKKCDRLVSTAFPPRQVGNPAAGSSKGSAAAQRDYFKKCVANDGKMDDAPKDAN